MRRVVEQGGTHALQEWTIKEDRKRSQWHRPKEIAHQALPDECVALMTWTMKAAKVADERHISKYDCKAGQYYYSDSNRCKDAILLFKNESLFQL